MKNLLFMFSFFMGMSAFAQEVKTLKSQEIFKISSPLQQQPEYPGGMGAVLQFISQNFRLPEDYKGEKGKIIAQFVIEKNGKIRDVNILKGITPSLDKEAIRVLRSMKRWKAGRNDGKRVRVRYTVPIAIKFNNSMY